MKKILKEISDLSQIISNKDNATSYFQPDILDKFEFKLFLTLDIVKMELKKNELLSNMTADALVQLFIFNCFEYYKQDFPEVYSACSKLFNDLKMYNNSMIANDVKWHIGNVDEKWVKYFSTAIKDLIETRN